MGYVHTVVILQSRATTMIEHASRHMSAHFAETLHLKRGMEAMTSERDLARKVVDLL